MNSTFKKDIDNTFFTDFAEIINLSGIRLKAIITDVKENSKLTGKFEESLDANTTYRRGLKISIKSRDLPPHVKVIVGDKITVNNEKFNVFDIERRHGITNFYIQRYGD